MSESFDSTEQDAGIVEFSDVIEDFMTETPGVDVAVPISKAPAKDRADLWFIVMGNWVIIASVALMLWGRR